MMTEIELLGGIVGSDGHLPNDASTIKIVTGDEEFLNSTLLPLIKRITSKKITVRHIDSGFGSKKFIVTFSDRRIKEILHNKLKIPLGKKSNIDIIPEIDNAKDKLDFVRGWFAGDGSVTTDRNRPRLTIWCNSKGTLEWIQSVLKENCIESKIWFAKKRNRWLLTIGKQESVKKFHEIIEIPHPKKERKLIILLNKKDFGSSQNQNVVTACEALPKDVAYC
jgi:DNA-binding transcriptional regulator WhiA